MRKAALGVLICLSILRAAQYDFSLAAGESRQWTLDLAPSDAAWLHVEKSGDLRLTVKSGNNPPRVIDSSRFSISNIEAVVIGQPAARLELTAVNPASSGGPRSAGRILVSDPHPATAREEKAWDAGQRIAEAQALEREPAKQPMVRGAWLAAVTALEEIGDRYNLIYAHRALAAWLARQQDFKSARQEYLLALRVLDGSSWRFEEAVVRQNLASIYSQTGDHLQAIAEQKIVLEIRDELRDRPGKGIALFGLGVTAWRMGAYQQALAYYQQSLALWSSLRERAWQAQVANAMGLLDVSLGRPGAARAHYREANSIWLDLHDERDRAMAISNEGLLSAAEDDTAKAEKLFAEALRIYERLHDQLSIAYVTQNLGDVAANSGNHAKALELYARSLKVKEGLGDARGAAGSRIRSGLSYLALNRCADAEREIRTALDLARRISDREEEAQALGALARLHLRVADLAAAEREISEAIRLIESTRLELRTRDTRAGYFSTCRDYYDLAMDIAAAREQTGVERAWTWSERARSRTLLDTLRRAGVDSMNSPETIASFAQLRKELLNGETLLVQYSVSAERTLAWAIDGHSARLVRLPGSNALKPALNEAAAGRLREIGNAIWKPLQVSNRYKTIIVAPEGGLERVPFAALPAGSGAVLVDQAEVVSVPSVSLLIARRRGRQPSPGEPAIFADAVFSPEDIRVQASIHDGDANALPRLRFTREEGTALAKLWGSGAELDMGFDASPDRLRAAASSSGPLLHIASHTVVDENDPSDSRIILSRVSPSGARIRGDLTLDEIFSLKVRKDLVVLSACSTAEGAEIRGEGMMSFARAFLYAGAKGLVATLFPVSDRASAEFISRFYTAIFSGGESPASALRRAQLQMKADPRWRSPRVWAAFVLFGDWDIRLRR